MEIREDGDGGAGRSRLLRVSISCVWLIACAVTSLAQPTARFVDDDAPRRGDGLSWATAYWRLQNAFDDAADGSVNEILVAGGLYTPDRGRAVERFDRDAAFELLEEVTVLGGFAGWDAPDPDERDIERYETILSGDLRGDDRKGLLDDNSDTVVRAAGVSAAAVLDGVTVTAATDAGVNFTNGSPTLRNCTFHGNGTRGVEGGNGTPTIEGCVFIANAFRHEGGGGVFVSDCDIFRRGFTRLCADGEQSFIRCRFIDCEFGGLDVRNGSLTVTDCLFEGTNERLRRALVTRADNTVVTNCVFRDNRAGAIENHGGTLSVVGCTFENNIARSIDRGGGAIFTYGILTIDSSVFENNAAMEGQGGAIFGEDVLTISGSSFIGNRAYGDDYSDGGAIFSEADLFLEDCVFEDNNAVRGGAIHQSSSPRHTLEATNCLFSRNTAQRAGAISKRDGGWISLRECAFIDNAALGPSLSWAGGAIWCFAREFELWDCQFVNNMAFAAGALYLTMDTAQLDVRRCQFISNTAVTRAGAVFSVTERGVWQDCTFVGNQAGESGGALQLLYSGAEYRRCTFEHNSALLGGAVHSEDSGERLEECDFVANQADRGGALYSLQSRPSIERCRFFDNRAETLGGAVYMQGGPPLLGNSLFRGNESAVDGGAIWVAGNGSPVFHGLTVADNIAARTAGGIGLADGSNSQIGNSILWGNRDGSGGGEAAQIVRLDTAELEINYSTVQGLTGELGGIGNIGDDPAFVDSATGDYHLTVGSPAIDAGDPDYRAAEGELDIDGDLRIWNDRIDMGADEFRPLGDLNCDGAIDRLDIEPFVLALFDPEAYESRYPDCEITLADLNRDHAVDAFDIEPFLAVLFP